MQAKLADQEEKMLAEVLESDMADRAEQLRLLLGDEKAGELIQSEQKKLGDTSAKSLAIKVSWHVFEVLFGSVFMSRLFNQLFLMTHLLIGY